MPPTDAPSTPAPAVTDNSTDRALDVVPVSENVTSEAVPGVGVDNPQRPDLATESQTLVNQNILNDVQFFDSAVERDGTPQRVEGPAGAQDANKEAPISAERRKEIDSVKSRVGDSNISAMDPAQQDKFYGSAIDTARNLTSANPDDRQKKYDEAMRGVAPEQRETFNKAIGVALSDQGSNLRTANQPPMGLLFDKSDPNNEKLVGRASIVEMPENFTADNRAFNAAPAVKGAIDNALSDVPKDQQGRVGNDIGNILATQESAGLFAPTKDVGARERPANLPSEQEQAAKLKGQLGPNGRDPVVNAAVEAANRIAFAKPEDMNRLFNEGMDSIRKTGVEPTSVAPILSQALNNVSKDLRISSTTGTADQAFLLDKRLATSANPDGTIGAANIGTAPGDAAANNVAFTKASEIAAAIRSSSEEQLGPTASKAELKDHVDRVFRIIRYF